MKKFLCFLIKCYQKYISPFLGDNCRYTPTCSAYAIEAIEIHGAIKGCILAFFRILRCNPFCKSCINPVPPKGKWKNTPQSLKQAQEKYAHQYLVQFGYLPKDE